MSGVNFTWPTGPEMVAWFKELGAVPDIGVYRDTHRSNGCHLCAVGVVAAHLGGYTPETLLDADQGHYFDQDAVADMIEGPVDRKSVVVNRRVAWFESGAWQAHQESRMLTDETTKGVPRRYVPDFEAGLAAWRAVAGAQRAGELPS